MTSETKKCNCHIAFSGPGADVFSHARGCAFFHEPIPTPREFKLAKGRPEVAVEVLLKDPLGWLHVPCPDYQTYCGLPLLVDFEGDVHTRRGWNSDRNVAYYEPGLHKVAFGLETPKETP